MRVAWSSPRGTLRGATPRRTASAAAVPTAWPWAMQMGMTRVEATASWVAERHLPAIMRFSSPRATRERRGRAEGDGVRPGGLRLERGAVRAVDVDVVAPHGDHVLEDAPVHHVLAGEDVVAHDAPALAHAQERRDLAQGRAGEPGDVLAEHP